MAVRAVIFYHGFLMALYSLGKFAILSVILVKTNWWKSDTEPWFTNASTTNFLISWIIWFPGMFLALITGLLGGITLICGTLSDKNFRRTVTFRFLFQTAPLSTYMYLIGRSIPEILGVFKKAPTRPSTFMGRFDYIEEDSGIERYEKVRRDLALSLKKGGSLTFVPKSDCGLCYLPLKDDDSVVNHCRTECPYHE